MTGRTGQVGRGGRVRPARLTDLSALGELSRLAQAADSGSRSLGLPLAGPPIGVFTLFRLPLGAFRPHDRLYVHEEDGHLGGLIRVERDSHRDEWTIVELDAVGLGDAGDIRYRLVQACLRDVARRGATRFHVACADVDGNVVDARIEDAFEVVVVHGDVAGRLWLALECVGRCEKRLM